jgi:hypothetical protein
LERLIREHSNEGEIQMKVMRSVKWSMKWNVLALAGLALPTAMAMGGCATLSAAGNDATPSKAELARQAEDFCAGVPAQTRAQGLLAYRDSFAGATPVSEDLQVGKTKISRPRGEMIALRAAPNITLPWLDRVNSCHVALVQAGSLNPAVSDPFVVPGTSVAIVETYAGYALSIKASSDRALKEVVERTGTVMAALREARQPSLTAEASAE